jgi:multiple sugar transport system substrate-binding protein
MPTHLPRTPSARRFRRAWPAATVAAVLSLAACGSGSDSSSPEDGDVTLTFWSHTHDPMNVLTEQIIADYEEQNPGVSVDYQVMPNQDFFTRMLTSLSTGAGPDVLNMNDVGLRGDYIPGGLVAELDPDAFGATDAAEVADRYTPSALEGATGADGTVYGIPSEFNATAFAYNTQHFVDAGLDPEGPPETWDEVVEYGEALAAAGHPQAFSFNYLHADSYTSQLNMLLNQTGGSVVDAGGAEQTFDSAESVEALDLWQELATSGIGDPNVATRDANNQVADLEAGTQSMMVVYPWGMAQIAQNAPEVYEQLAVAPLPQVDPAEPVSEGYAYYWAVNEASEQQAEAWKFIEFMSTYSEDWLADVSFVQPLDGWEEGAAAQAMDGIDVWAQAYASVSFAPVAPHWSEVQETVMNTVNDVVFNGVDPAEAVEAAAPRIQQSIAE